MARPDSWFRLYNTAVDNPKVQRLPDALFKAWVNLLCIASRHGGRLPGLADTAFALRVSESVAQSWLVDLEARCLLDRDADGRLVPHDWSELQFKTDRSTDRVKRHRARRSGAPMPDETPHETVGETAGETLHETVGETRHETPPEQNRSDQNRSEPPNPPAGGLARAHDFSKFWEAYPEKIGLKAALAAWEKAVDRPALADILAAVARYVRAKPADRAWCSPARWLKEGRWNDAPAMTAAALAGPLTGGRPAEQWRWAAKMLATKKYWPPSFGPQPGLSGCECPPAILREFNLAEPGPTAASAASNRRTQA